MGNSFSPHNRDLVGKHSLVKWFCFINASPYLTQILSYHHPLFLPVHGRLRCYAHNKDYSKILLILLQKVEWHQFASPQEPLWPWPEPSIRPRRTWATPPGPQNCLLPSKSWTGQKVEPRKEHTKFHTQRRHGWLGAPLAPTPHI